MLGVFVDFIGSLLQGKVIRDPKNPLEIFPLGG